jgi:hypothetical protein
MHIKTVAALAAVASFTLVAPQAHAEGRFSFINKYIEKYAKVKPGDTIGSGRFDLGSLTYNGLGSPVSPMPKKLSSLGSRIGK